MKKIIWGLVMMSCFSAVADSSSQLTLECRMFDRKNEDDFTKFELKRNGYGQRLSLGRRLVSVFYRTHQLKEASLLFELLHDDRFDVMDRVVSRYYIPVKDLGINQTIKVSRRFGLGPKTTLECKVIDL